MDFKNMENKKSKNWKLNLGILWCAVFLVCASYTMVVPFLPIFLLKEIRLSTESAKLWSGAIIAVTFVVSAFMAPYWGARGDIIGQKRNALRAGIGLSICYLLSGLAQTPWELFSVRFLTGVICGFVPACMSIASSTLPEEVMGQGMGLMQTANASGSITGPLLGGILSNWFSMRASFFVAAAALFTATLAIFLLVYEKRSALAVGAASRMKLSALLKDLGRAITNRTLLYIMCIFGLLKACVMLIQPLLALYVNDLLGGADNAVRIAGFIMSLAGIAGIIAAPYWGHKGQRYGYARILSLVMFCAGLTNLCQLVTNGIWSFGAVYFVFGLFMAGAAPNLLSYMVETTAIGERGKAFGLTTSADQMGGAVGPLLGGFLGTFLSMGQIMAVVGVLLMFGSCHIYHTKVKKMSR